MLLIDASDPRLRASLTKLPPRQQPVAHIALSGRVKNAKPNWDCRVDALMADLQIDSTAEMAKLLTEVRKACDVVEQWAAGNGQ